MQEQSKTKDKLAKAGVEDLVLMAKVDEGAIVENLKKRYFCDLIYVRAIARIGSSA